MADVCIVEKLAAAIDSDHTEDVSHCVEFDLIYLKVVVAGPCIFELFSFFRSTAMLRRHSVILSVLVVIK